MRTGDPLSDSTQGTIGFAVKIEAAFGRGDDMGPALPFAPPARAPGRTLVPFSGAMRPVSEKALARVRRRRRVALESPPWTCSWSL